MSVEWRFTDEEKAEYQRYVAEWEVTMRMAECDPENLRECEPSPWGTFIGYVLVILTSAAFWAALAVFCWGGNLWPRW